MKSQLSMSDNGMLPPPPRALRQSLSSFVRSLKHAAIAADACGPVLVLNSAAEKLLGYRSKEVRGLPLQALLKVESADYAVAFQPDRYEHVSARTKSGAILVLEARCSSLETRHRSVILALLRDVSARERASEELERRILELEQSNARLENLVNSDPLTGLLNRRGLDDMLLRLISSAQRNQSELLAALLDLDDFKSINDLYGHHIGDTVLRGVAQTMQKSMRGCDWVARVGGDEFVLLFPSLSLADGALVADRIRCGIADAVVMTALGRVRTTASIGIISLPLDVRSTEEVLELTTGAIKASKTAGKNCVSIGQPARMQTTDSRIRSYMERRQEKVILARRSKTASSCL